MSFVLVISHINLLKETVNMSHIFKLPLYMFKVFYLNKFQSIAYHKSEQSSNSF